MHSMSHKKRLLAATAAVTVFLSVLCAADTPKDTAKAKKSDASGAVAKTETSKPSLGNWWDKSSLEFDKVPSQVLFHGTANASYMNAQGNTQGSMFSGSVDLIARKERYTNHLIAQDRKQNMTYGFGGGSVNLTETTLKDFVEYDLTSHALAVAGVEDYHNSFLFIDRRLTYYGGLGSTLVETKQHLINVIGGIGYANFKFDRANMVKVSPVAVASLPATAVTPSSGGALVTETWRWTFSPKLTVMQDGTYMKYFDSALGHRWEFGVNLKVPLAKYVSLVPSYRIRDEVNIITNALRVKPQDRTLSIGLSVSF